jgi:hypothetical protein
LLAAKTPKDVEAEAAAKGMPDFEIELEAAIANAFREPLGAGRPVVQPTESAARETAALGVLKEALVSAEAETSSPRPPLIVSTTPSVPSAPPTPPAPPAGDNGFDEQAAPTLPPFSADLFRKSNEPELPPPPPFVIKPLHKRHIWPLFICAIIIFIVLTGGLTYATQLIKADQVETRAAIQREGSGYLDESIALIQEADIVVIALDKAIESQVREEDIPQLEALLEQVDATYASLDKAIETAGRAQATFLEKESQELAQHAQEAAEYRKQMLKLSAELTDFDVAAMKGALSLEYAWSLIVDADAGMRSAVEMVAGGGANAVWESRDYNAQALDKLVLAGEMLAVTTTTFPTTDLRVMNDYLKAKQASAELALASDDAFLAGDYDAANAYNEEFIAMDAEAVSLAVGIPSDPLTLVVRAYEEAVRQLREDYKLVRSRAADADGYLRTYLGVDIQHSEAGAQEGDGLDGGLSGEQDGGPDGGPDG